VLKPQTVSKAFWAALTARSMSAAVPMEMEVMVLPFAAKRMLDQKKIA
jgi:hypothetical protein